MLIRSVTPVSIESLHTGVMSYTDKDEKGNFEYYFFINNFKKEILFQEYPQLQ